MKTDRRLLESSYARTLLPLARNWRQAADRALANLDVSAACGWALIQVERMGDDVRQTDLARELDISSPSLVRLIDQLSAAGMVDRHVDAADGRVSRIRLTDKGLTQSHIIEEALAGVRSELLASVSDTDLASALAVAAHVEAAIGRPRAGR